MKPFLTVACAMMVAVCGNAGAKSTGNLPYAASFAEHSPFYARRIPNKADGEEGSTQILRVRPEGDEVVATFPWYNRNGIVMGWSPKAGKVAVMRTRQNEGLAPGKRITTGELCPNNAKAKVDLNPPKALPAKPTLDAIANLPPYATLEDLLKITGQPGVDFGSAIHDYVFGLDDPSTIHVRAHYDGKLISIEHHQFRVTELLHKP